MGAWISAGGAMYLRVCVSCAHMVCFMHACRAKYIVASISWASISSRSCICVAHNTHITLLPVALLCSEDRPMRGNVLYHQTLEALLLPCSALLPTQSCPASNTCAYAHLPAIMRVSKLSTMVRPMPNQPLGVLLRPLTSSWPHACCLQDATAADKNEGDVKRQQ
jgi:hypothetical protein